MSNKQINQSVIEIIKAYVSGNEVPVEELPRLLTIVRETLFDLERSTGNGEQKLPTPAVAVRKSVSRHRIVCLEDGRKFKSLKRHLQTAHGLSPEDYRAKWGLEKRYPMVAPAYSKLRARLAVKTGLGRGRHATLARKTGKGPSTNAA